MLSPKSLVRIAAAFTLLTSSLCMAQDDLLRLLPPGTPVLAGMRATPSADRDVLWLVAPANVADLSQFRALAANDPFHRIDSVVAADLPSPSNALGDHLLLASGFFDIAQMAPYSTQFVASRYRGVPILRSRPVSGDGSGVWLAVLHSRIALYGSPGAVRLAIDRALRRAPADPALAQRLRTLPRGEEAWSSVRLGARQVRSSLRLARDAASARPCLQDVSELALGLHRGSSVRLDLRAIDADGNPTSAALACVAGLLHIDGGSGRLVSADRNPPSLLRVSLSSAGYDRWLGQFRRSRAAQMILASIDPQAGPATPASSR